MNDHSFILEYFKRPPSGLYITKIRRVESHLNEHIKNTKDIELKLWHDRLGHPRSIMMRRIISQSHGHNLEIPRISKNGGLPYHVCSEEKLLIKPSKIKVDSETPYFLKRSKKTFVD